MKESCWEDCINENSSIKITYDKAKAKFLIETAEGRIKFVSNNKIDETNANYIFECYYTSILELIQAIVSIHGFKVSNHLCLGFFLRDVLKKEDLFSTFDDCRFKRNSLVYYGNKMNFETSKQAIKKSQELFNELLKLYKKINP